MKQLLPFLCFLVCLPQLLAGQPTQSARAEIPVNADFREFYVWPLPDSTVAVLKVEKTFRRNADPFVLYRFDQHLQERWRRPLELARGTQFLTGTTQQNSCYLLFDGLKRDEYFLVRIDTRTGLQALSRHLLPEGMSFKVTSMQALDGYLFLTGLQNNRLAVLHLNPEATDMQKIPAIYDQSTALAEFQADTLAGRAEFILAESNGLKGRLQVKRLAPDGHLVSLSFLQHHDYNYLAGRLSPGDSLQKIIAGTYSFRDLRYAQGFFAGPFLPTGNQSLKYHNFTSFSHYFDYLRPGRQEKLRRKVARFQVTSKFLQLRQRLLLHRIYPLAQGYALVGEMYAPQYQNEGAGRGTFEGYEFTQTVVAAVDRQGNLLWENSLPMQRLRKFELQEMVTVGVAGNRVILCYPEDEKIWYKVITGNETSPNDKYLAIGSGIPSDKISSTYPEGIKAWYHNHFIAFGEQTIRGANGFRTVFYLNKLTF